MIAKAIQTKSNRKAAGKMPMSDDLVIPIIGVEILGCRVGGGQIGTLVLRD